MKKIVRIGTIDGTSVFCKIEFDGKRLSISGVEGPQKNGDSRGGCGQIIIGYREYDERGHSSIRDIKPAPGWDDDKIKQFFDAWDRWHLNDVRAGCEHQRGADWDASRKVELVKYKLTQEASEIRKHAEKKAIEAAADGVIADCDETERALLKCEWFKETTTPPDADSPLSGCYEVANREMKAIGWIGHNEHPQGLLSKPCPVCGYKYGTAWKSEEVPSDVIAFLESLPDTDRKPAWV